MHPEMRITGEGLKITNGDASDLMKSCKGYNTLDVKWILADKTEIMLKLR